MESIVSCCRVTTKWPEIIPLLGSAEVSCIFFTPAGQKLSGVTGSPAYVAPEVLVGNYSEKVDIWAPGVLLHVLLIASLPFQGGSVKAVFEAIKTVEIDFHSDKWEPVSALARDLISRMLNRDVSSRLDAAEVLRHPWILMNTECPLRAEFCDLWHDNKPMTPRICDERVMSDWQCSSSESSSDDSDEQADECGIVDALTAAITPVRISEPKRGRVCTPAIRTHHECSSSLKENPRTGF